MDLKELELLYNKRSPLYNDVALKNLIYQTLQNEGFVKETPNPAINHCCHNTVSCLENSTQKRKQASAKQPENQDFKGKCSLKKKGKKHLTDVKEVTALDDKAKNPQWGIKDEELSHYKVHSDSLPGCVGNSDFKPTISVESKFQSQNDNTSFSVAMVSKTPTSSVSLASVSHCSIQDKGKIDSITSESVISKNLHQMSADENNAEEEWTDCLFRELPNDSLPSHNISINSRSSFKKSNLSCSGNSECSAEPVKVLENLPNKQSVCDDTHSGKETACSKLKMRNLVASLSTNEDLLKMYQDKPDNACPLCGACDLFSHEPVNKKNSVKSGTMEIVETKLATSQKLNSKLETPNRKESMLETAHVMESIHGTACVMESKYGTIHALESKYRTAQAVESQYVTTNQQESKLNGLGKDGSVHEIKNTENRMFKRLDLEEINHIITVLVKANGVFREFPKKGDSEKKLLMQKQNEFLETSKLKNADPETLAKHKEETRKRLLECTVDYIEMRITEAVKFAKKIPGFVQLPLDDQVNLVKESRTESGIIGGMRGINSSNQVFSSHNGYFFTLQDMRLVFSQNLLQQTMVLSKKIAALDLSPSEEALLRAITIMASDRCPLSSMSQVEEIQQKLLACLEHVITSCGKIPAGPRLGKLMDVLISCRDVTEVDMKEVKGILLEWPSFSKYKLVEEFL